MKYISTFKLFEFNQHDYEIRLATTGDYTSIKKICNQNREWLPFVMRVAIEESIGRGEVMVAEEDGKVIGFIHFHKRRDGVTTLHEIGVDMNYQRLGIARSLISRLGKPIKLKVVKDNPANEFYQRLGFELIGSVFGRTRELNIYQLV